MSPMDEARADIMAQVGKVFPGAKIGDVVGERDVVQINHLGTDYFYRARKYFRYPPGELMPVEVMIQRVSWEIVKEICHHIMKKEGE